MICTYPRSIMAHSVVLPNPTVLVADIVLLTLYRYFVIHLQVAGGDLFRFARMEILMDFPGPELQSSAGHSS